MTIANSNIKSALPWALCIMALLCCELFFFRNVINGGGNLIGDAGDGRLTTLFAEHWFHVYCGESAIQDMGIFYPAEDTIAYSDMFFALGTVHSLFRFVGLDIYRAYKATVMLFHALGTFAAFYLLKKTLGTRWGWALFGAMAFSISGAYATMMIRTQFVMVSVLPLYAILICGFVRAIGDRGKRSLYAIALIALFALTLYTAWYVAFFVILYAAVLLVVWLASALLAAKPIKTRLTAIAKQAGRDWLYYFLLLVATCVPFVLAELPILEMSGGRSYGEVWIFLPEPIDLINVSSSNWLLGRLFSFLGLGSRTNVKTNETPGYNIVLLLVLIVELLAIRWKASRKKPIDNAGKSVVSVSNCLLVVTATALFTCMLLRLSQTGASLWWPIFRFFPGGSSIRSPGRFLLLLSFPLAIAVSVVGDALFRGESGSHVHERSRRPLMLVLLAALFVSCVNGSLVGGGVYSAWNSNAQRAYLNGVAPPGDRDAVFFIANVPEGHQGFLGQIDAYEIADAYSLRTINGHSGLYPEGYGSIEHIDSDDYIGAIDAWIGRYGLENVYEYDAATNRWKRFAPSSEEDASGRAYEKGADSNAQ